MKNPFFNADKPSERVAMPVINVNIGANFPASPVPPQQQPQPYHAQYSPAPAESSRHWVVALCLAVFLGVFGVHRFYTGHNKIGLFQLLTFGGAGLWTAIDIILILTGVYKDNKGLPLSGPHRSKKIVFGGIGLLVLSCIGLMIFVDTSSKVELPADHGWITGIDRCSKSNSYGELILRDNINIWQDWGRDLGNAVGTVAHDTPVTVLEGKEYSTDKVIYYKIETKSGLKGWISEQFIQFQPPSDGIVPRKGC